MKPETKTPEQERTSEVNGLLKKSFGRTAQGNLMDYDYTPLPTQEGLGMIARGFKIPGFYQIIGRFDKGDGSELRILPKHEAQAREYATLYEEQFGTRATVTVDPKATYGTPCF